MFNGSGSGQNRILDSLGGVRVHGHTQAEVASLIDAGLYFFRRTVERHRVGFENRRDLRCFLVITAN